MPLTSMITVLTEFLIGTSSVKGRVRLSKIGNARLRKALYFPAITALPCSPFMQQWANGLRERGKSKLSVVGAVVRSYCILLTVC